MIRTCFIAAVILLSACTQKTKPSGPLITFRQAFLDSIIKGSDTSYSKPYKRPDFVKAEYYRSKTDSSVCQVMRDSANSVRQVIISRGNVRTYFAQYYANGQLIADLKQDVYGQNDGPATYYNENGTIKRAGNYSHGFSTGSWKEYDENGIITVVRYDSNGTRMN